MVKKLEPLNAVIEIPGSNEVREVAQFVVKQPMAHSIEIPMLSREWQMPFVRQPFEPDPEFEQTLLRPPSYLERAVA